MKSLVIVESPTKARTISKFLGKDFVVESSFGHVRDLPSSTLGVDVEHNFEPKYVIPRKASPHVKKLKELAKKSDAIVLATDEDREGEAIAWHLTQALGLENSKSPARPAGGQNTISKQIQNSKNTKTQKQDIKNVQRIVFHEITKKAIEEALHHPREIDINLVNAQQARRVLDRIVGYKLSPFLWKKIVRGLSAGRVQSVAVRLIVDREREIEKFRPEEYWTILAHVDKEPPFSAGLWHIDGKQLEKLSIGSQKQADDIIADLADASYTVASIEKKETKRSPHPPFTTSTLQQAASQRFGFSARQTMRLAQQLYEEGLITYMRTDSLNLSTEAVAAARTFIQSEFGTSYTLSHARTFKTKSKGAQEAHEAIRPTDVTRTPASVAKNLDKQQQKLYEFIWQRFVATQMPEAVFDATSIDIESKGKRAAYVFRATGSMLRFDGFLKVYPLKTEDTLLPELSRGEKLNILGLEPKQHFTEPPPRYTEASLIKMLEKNGIGRPSTYAPTIGTIQERNYVQKNEAKRFQPTEMGMMVTDMLVEHFPNIVDVTFTAAMEETLDKIAAGSEDWVPAIRAFYEPFEELLQTKYKTVEKQTADEQTDEVCDKCGKPMLIKNGRFGKFLACSGFPDCRNTKRLPQDSLGIKCPSCTNGDIIQRRSKRGKVFYGCSAYPACTFALWDRPTGEKCKTCESMMVEKGGNIVCSNKECKKNEL
ncbi:MAG: DNA topoisomerase I [Parcubacteria group bacterium Gr01-1014_70]|nr:MAG: DNA topoisomerase I [Parcubacteria group bacterium Gr01-1014_70]